jgi:transcriptional regulator with XRE-family HTH domain
MRLKELRIKNNLTQQQIAEILQITQFTYSNYEKEKTQPDIEILKKLADYYKVSLDYLLEHETEGNVDTSSFSDTKKGCVLLIEKLTEENATILLGYITHMVHSQS